jgi:CheY-like chemotaxis protein
MTDLSLFDYSEAAPRMLIADDDPAIVRMLADRCASVGFEVETATNGLQALIKANRSHPDILIIDVNMPEADGLSVCARLLDPLKRPLNVVVVTGSREAETVERCEGFGAFYVRKGPEFWGGLASALTETFPRMAGRLKELNAQPSAEIRKRPRVLVVDDDPYIKSFLSSRLDKCGVDLLYSADASQGFKMACREEPSVIICDLFMPNGGIRYLLARLRTTPGTETIPVFVLTGRVLDDQTIQNLRLEICGQPGASRVFVKSLDTDELFGALQKVCGFEYNRAAE